MSILFKYALPHLLSAIRYLCGGRISTLVLLSALIVAVGCQSNRDALNDIDVAERLAQDNPDEAMTILQSIDADKLRRTRDKARYALVHSEICYHSENYIATDSLARFAANYYTMRGSGVDAARASFYYGHACMHGGQTANAMLAFMDAAKRLANGSDYYLEGLVHQAMGDIYGGDCLYRNGYESYVRSKFCFERAQRADNVAYANFDLGRMALAMRDYEAAESSLLLARDYAMEINDCDFLPLVIYYLGELYVQLAEYEKCAEALSLYEQSGCNIYDESHYYSLMAVVEATRGNISKAKEYIASAEGTSQPNENLISYANYCVSRIAGDKESALHWLEHTTQRQDSTILMTLEQPVLNYQIKMLQDALESKEREAELRRQRNTAIYIAILFVIIVMTGFVINRIHNKNRDIQHYMETIHELQLTRSHSSERLSSAVSVLYHDRLNDLNRLCETYYDHSDTSRHAAKVFEQVRQTIEAIKSDKQRLEELESVVNNYRNNLMSKLREQCPKLNERELRVALYSYAGFSSRAICIFVESNPIALSKVKYRIKTKIKESGAENADELIAAIIDC